MALAGVGAARGGRAPPHPQAFLDIVGYVLTFGSTGVGMLQRNADAEPEGCQYLRAFVDICEDFDI